MRIVQTITSSSISSIKLQRLASRDSRLVPFRVITPHPSRSIHLSTFEMASSSSVLSETLQSITVTKIRELEKQKQSYVAHKKKVIDSAEDESNDIQTRISILSKGIEDTIPRSDYLTRPKLENIARWTHQSVYDPSVPKTKLHDFEDQLRLYLDQGSRKLELAHVYSRLLTEWIKSSSSANIEPEDLEGSGSDESFEVVQDTQKARLEQLRDKFARVVFEPLETDEVEIDNYLLKLFEGDSGERSLKILRREVSDYGKWMLQDSFRLNDQSLKWCIKALLKNDLLNDEKKASLNDFLKDDAVLGEIRDVLNMRFRDLRDWNWNLGEEGMDERLADLMHLLIISLFSDRYACCSAPKLEWKVAGHDG